MKNYRLLTLLLITLLFTACGKGVETRNPQPVENIAVHFTTASNGKYTIETGDEGEGTISQYNYENTLIESLPIYIETDEFNIFEVDATFTDSTNVFVQAELLPDNSANIIKLLINGKATLFDIVDSFEEESTTEEQSQPETNTPVSNKAASIGVGESHTCAILNEGEVWCWGDNSEGQLGFESEEDEVIEPQQVPLLSRIKAITGGKNYTYAVSNDGSLLTWGKGDLKPKTILEFDPITQIVTGKTESTDFKTCISEVDGDVWCWLEYDGADIEKVEGIFAAEELIQDKAQICTIQNSELWCWGTNLNIAKKVECDFQINDAGLYYGLIYVLDYNGAVWQKTPITDFEKVEGLSNIKEIHSGLLETLFVDNAGSILNPMAEEIEGVSELINIAIGPTHTCAVQSDEEIKCWGLNDKGQLGREITNSRQAPQIVKFKYIF